MRRWLWPGWLVAAILGTGVVVATVGPLRDIDTFWHVRLGNELLNGVSIYTAGNDWSYAPVQDNWVSTQWIVEILFAWLVNAWSWNGLIVHCTVTSAVALLTLALSTLPSSRLGTARNRVWASLIVFTLAAFSLLVFTQERPQQISYILLPIVGFWWLRAVRDSVAPRWWLLLILTAIWANCHGLWVLLPLALALALAGRLWDNGWGDPLKGKLALGVIVSLVGGSITPIGPLNLLTPIRFAASTEHITEWQPASVIEPSSAGLVLMAAVLIIAWAFGRARPGKAEVLYALVMLLFGVSAGRNITPAVLMLAPMAAWRLSAAFSGPRRRSAPEGLVRVAKPAAVAIYALAVLMGTYLAATVSAIPRDSVPLGLVQVVALRSEPQRVLNGYNVSGLLLYYARPEVSRNFARVGIDGRADRYGAAYIDDYIGMELGLPIWHEMVAELNPTIALLPNDDPLTALLTLSNWQVVGEENGYTLLEPPSTGVHHH